MRYFSGSRRRGQHPGADRPPISLQHSQAPIDLHSPRNMTSHMAVVKKFHRF
jgi:hypothetical protein